MQATSKLTNFVRQQKFEIRCSTSLNVCLHSILSVSNPILGLMFLSKFMMIIMKEKKWKFNLFYPKSVDSEIEPVSKSFTRHLIIDGLDPVVSTEFVNIIDNKFSLPMNEIKDFNIILQGKGGWDLTNNTITINGFGGCRIWVCVVVVDHVNVIGYVVFDNKKVALYLTNNSYITWDSRTIKLDIPVIVAGLNKVF
ncbi:hypothetical protein [Salmon gill poxvirus]|uniref:Uncharacterized protein n=1 Tax=Salmon gill poxvirus TaxID=1680908 RepID=A0A0H4Y1A7_9POXV|nr:hypothetical protein AL387_gp166 [Salmon gill poxvirus]AKR04290.1 hypothetical protein SGPV166 [Salmon gill poxvirus]WMX26578.1 hypothetical protein [Salmon gill poxvirus]